MKAQEKEHHVAKEIKGSDKKTYLNEHAEKAEKAASNGQMRTLYQTTKALSGKFSLPEVHVKTKMRKIIFEIKRWVEYFKEPWNRQPPPDPPDIILQRMGRPINCEPPTRDEIGSVVKSLNLWKAARSDHIPSEALKSDISLTIEILHGIFTNIWNDGSLPRDWKEGHLI